MVLRAPLETNNQGSIRAWKSEYDYFYLWITGQEPKNQGTTELPIVTRTIGNMVEGQGDGYICICFLSSLDYQLEKNIRLNSSIGY